MTRSHDRVLRERAAAVIPGGMYGHQAVGLLPDDYPQFFSRAEGAHIWDADGNQTFVETDVEAPGGGWFRRRSTERDQGFDLGAVFLPTSTRDDSD